MSKLEKFASDFHEKWMHDRHAGDVANEGDDSADELEVLPPLSRPELRDKAVGPREEEGKVATQRAFVAALWV